MSYETQRIISAICVREGQPMHKRKPRHKDQEGNPYIANGENRKRERLGHISARTRRRTELLASLTFAAVLVLLNMSLAGVPIVEARATTWHVHPGESIQAFVDSANPGDRIIVHAGQYHQSVTIGKSISLTGNRAILDGTPPADQHTTVGDTGIMILQGTSGVAIDGFEIRDYTTYAISADGVGNIKIVNNLIHRVSTGIYIGNGNNVEISNNIVQDLSFYGIVIGADKAPPSKNIRVIKNRVTRVTTTNPEFGGRGVYVIGVSALTNVMIVGNRISRCQYDGVKVRSEGNPGNVRDVDISNNEIDSSGEMGIDLEGVSRGEVVKNKVTNSISSGILLLDSDHVNVVAGLILDNGYGIALAGSENINVVANTVRRNREWGIALTHDEYGIPSNNNVVVSNVAKGNGSYDLYDDGSGTGNIWRGNIYSTKNW